MEKRLAALEEKANARNRKPLDIIIVVIGPGFIVEDALRRGVSVSPDELADIRRKHEIERPVLLEKYKHAEMHQPFLPYQPDPRTIDTQIPLMGVRPT